MIHQQLSLGVAGLRCGLSEEGAAVGLGTVEVDEVLGLVVSEK
jgi:hypothetical protein